MIPVQWAWSKVSWGKGYYCDYGMKSEGTEMTISV